MYVCMYVYRHTYIRTCVYIYTHVHIGKCGSHDSQSTIGSRISRTYPSTVFEAPLHYAAWQGSVEVAKAGEIGVALGASLYSRACHVSSGFLSENVV